MLPLGKLSKAEKEVMEIIWQKDSPVTVNQLLGFFTNWKNSTLATILSRLIDKGFLAKSMSGKTNFYAPIITQKGYIGHENKIFLHDLHKGNMINFIASLFDDDSMSMDDLNELRAWLDGKAGDDK